MHFMTTLHSIHVNEAFLRVRHAKRLHKVKLISFFAIYKKLNYRICQLGPTLLITSKAVDYILTMKMLLGDYFDNH